VPALSVMAPCVLPLEVWALEIQTKKKAKNAYSITIERLLKRPTS
jgi:hypothetical protein